MDIKETKDYLNQIRFLDRVISHMLEEIYELRVSATSIGAVQNKEKVQTSPGNDKIGAIVSKIVDMEKRTDEIVDRRADMLDDVRKTIVRIESDKQRKILWMKYIDGKSISQIAEELEVETRWCKRLHNKALEEFGKIHKNRNI